MVDQRNYSLFICVTEESLVKVIQKLSVSIREMYTTVGRRTLQMN